jgi:hypothetical protein
VTKYIYKEFCHTKQIDKIMNKLPAIFATLRSNLSFVIVLPVFWLSFVLLYQPSKLVELLDMGNGMLNFNATIIMCILLGVMIISRGVLMVIHHTLELNWFKLMVWEVAEVITMSLFTALYITLMYHGKYTYFYMTGQCLYQLMLITLFPYIIFNLAFAYVSVVEQDSVYDDSLMRFYDNTQKLKLMIASSAVLYVEADENYVHVRYMEGNHLKDFPLRASMKSLEELMQKHGLVRCQRSYYINPQHIKVLRRDKEGMISAELDIANQKSIPVSPKYYDSLAKWL